MEHGKSNIFNPVAQFGNGEIVLSGTIASVKDEEFKLFDAASFIEDLRKHEAVNTSLKIKLVNLYGGSVYEGLSIYSAIKESKIPVTLEVHGLVASMGTIIALAVPVERTYIDKYSRMMFHNVQGSAHGNVKDLENSLEEMKTLENQIKDIYSERTGKTVEEITEMWFDGSDHFLRAQEVVDLKIIGSILNGFITQEPTASMSAEQVAQFYAQQINKPNNNNMKKLQIMVSALMAFNPKLNEASSEDDVLATVQQLTNNYEALNTENQNLKTQLLKFEEDRVMALVDGAIKDNKIRPAQKEQYTKLAKLDYETTSNLLAELKPYQPFAPSANQGGKADDRADWTYQKWAKEDPKGLANMKANQPEQFAELKKKSFNR